MRRLGTWTSSRQSSNAVTSTSRSYFKSRHWMRSYTMTSGPGTGSAATLGARADKLWQLESFDCAFKYHVELVCASAAEWHPNMACLVQLCISGLQASHAPALCKVRCCCATSAAASTVNFETVMLALQHAGPGCAPHIGSDDHSLVQLCKYLSMVKIHTSTRHCVTATTAGVE